MGAQLVQYGKAVVQLLCFNGAHVTDTASRIGQPKADFSWLFDLI